MRDNFMIFADESGTDNNHKCYSIGAIKLSISQYKNFTRMFSEEKQKHKVVGELKWNKIGNSYGTNSFCKKLFEYIIKNKIVVGIIVVKKDVFRQWQENKEKGFYMTYNFLLRHLLINSPADFDVYIDDRQDSYDKQDEVMEIITNRMLNKIGAEAKINKVTKSNSKLLIPIQFCDIITGAVNASHNLILDQKYSINNGKRELIKEFASLLGWDDLCYDTYPNNILNIWQFPIEYRAYSGSKEICIIQ